MKLTTIGYQGASGAFSEVALLSTWPGRVQPRGYASFRAVGDAVGAGEVDYGLLPLENTLAGTVTGSYDVLSSEPLLVMAEIVTPIHHCLLVCPGADIQTIRRVASHPVALGQCTRFFSSHPDIEPVVAFDTAGAAAELAESGDRTLGAIAPAGCAERYGLDVLVSGLEDRPDNQTRFAVVAPEHASQPFGLPRAGHERAMLRVEVPHERGTLARVLSLIAEEGHNLLKIEGRPAEDPWTYRFFLEIAPALHDSWQARLLDRLSPHWRCRVMGVYPRLASRMARNSVPSFQLGHASESMTSRPIS